MGTFDSLHIYLVQCSNHEESSLGTPFEETVYVWVGSEMAQQKDAVRDAIVKARSVATTSKMVWYCRYETQHVFHSLMHVWCMI